MGDQLCAFHLDLLLELNKNDWFCWFNDLTIYTIRLHSLYCVFLTTQRSLHPIHHHP